MKLTKTKVNKANAKVIAKIADRLGLYFLSGTLDGSRILRTYSSAIFASIFV